MFLKAARMLDISAFEQCGLRRYIDEHRRGAFELGAPTNDVYEVTGRAPEDFETIARRYAALPEARRTIANRWRAVGDFMRIGFTRAYDLDRFEREQQHPLLGSSQLAIDSDAWRMEHDVKQPSNAASLRRMKNVRPGSSGKRCSGDTFHERA
jgi:NAD(P)H dehydrogenase (quinone)